MRVRTTRKNDGTQSDKDAATLKEARDRFKRCEAWEASARANWKEDVKFSEGDSDNLWQWPDDILAHRETNQRPILTINTVRQHNLDVLNDARMAKVGVKIIPTGGEATYESAEAFMGVVRAIEYRSSADTAYQHGLKHAVQGGIGYWRILTAYAADDSFDLEIMIKRVKNPLLIYLDPDISEVDGLDANFGFVTVLMPKEEAERKYPQYKDQFRNTSLVSDDGWISNDHVRIAEYWRRVPTQDTLVSFLNPVTEDRQQGLLSELRQAVAEAPDKARAAEVLKLVMDDENTLTREVTRWAVECITIIGNEIANTEPWLGIYIPIIRVVGEETVVDGQMDRKGHTRHLKDAQRMFNFNASAFIEYGALQTKVPWVGAIEAIEDFKEYWESANTENHSVLPYNARDEQGNEIKAPTRPEPPRSAPLYLEGMNAAAEWMRMASGQYQADMGAPSNERSGKAINERRREGDMATFHYLDHQSTAIRATGKVLIDLIPKVYDTERVLRYKGDDGKELAIKVDPKLRGPVDSEQIDADTTMTIFNPNVGRYEVEADVGKSFATKRQEAFEAGTQILAQNPELTNIIGDLLFQNADFPGADEIARRLKRLVPAQALDEAANPEVQALQGQLQEAMQALQTMAKQLEDKSAEQRTAQEKVAVSGYDSITKRLASVKEALALDPNGLRQLVREVIMEAIATSDSGAALEPAIDVPATYKEMPETMPAAMGGPALDGGPPPAAPA